MFSFRCLMFVFVMLAMAFYSLPQATAGDCNSRNSRGNCGARNGNCGARNGNFGPVVEVRSGRRGRTFVRVN